MEKYNNKWKLKLNGVQVLSLGFFSVILIGIENFIMSNRSVSLVSL